MQNLSDQPFPSRNGLPPRFDDVELEQRLEELQSHTPEGLDAPPDVRWLSLWVTIPPAVVLFIALCVTLVFVGGWVALVVAIVLLPMFYFLASSPLWITALIRAKEHNDLKHRVEQEMFDDETKGAVLR